MFLKKFALGFCIAASSIVVNAAIGDAGSSSNVTVTSVTSLLNVNEAWINVSPVPAECDFHPTYGGPHISIPLSSNSGRLATSVALTAKSTGSSVNVAWASNCVIQNISIQP